MSSSAAQKQLQLAELKIKKIVLVRKHEQTSITIAIAGAALMFCLLARSIYCGANEKKTNLKDLVAGLIGSVLLFLALYRTLSQKPEIVHYFKHRREDIERSMMRKPKGTHIPAERCARCIEVNEKFHISPPS